MEEGGEVAGSLFLVSEGRRKRKEKKRANLGGRGGLGGC